MVIYTRYGNVEVEVTGHEWHLKQEISERGETKRRPCISYSRHALPHGEHDVRPLAQSGIQCELYEHPKSYTRHSSPGTL